eukprot:gene4869-3488_t
MRRYEREPFESAATFQEATVRYIGRVKTTFTNQPDVYKEFVDIVREVRRNELSPSVALDVISRLFLGHPDLVVDFQRYFGGFSDATPASPDDASPRPLLPSSLSSSSSSSSATSTAASAAAAAPSSRPPSRLATLHNFIFFAAAVVVLCAVAVKVLFYAPPTSPSGGAAAPATALDASSRPFRDSFLLEHLHRTQQRQLTRAARLLQQHTAAQATTLEQLLSVSSDDVHASLPPTATCHVDNTAASSSQWNQSQFDALPWQFLHSHRDVDTFVKHVPQSKLLAFRGVTLMEHVHLSAALGPFLNVSQSLAWIPLLQHIEALPVIDRVDRRPFASLQDAWYRHRQAAAAAAAATADGASSATGEAAASDAFTVEALVEALRNHRDQWRWTQSDTLYQILRLPWPISARDLQLYRHFTFDAAARQVTIRYFSVTEDDPDRLTRWRQLLRRGGRSERDVIRAVTPHTMWRFTAVPAAAAATDDDGNDSDSDAASGTTQSPKPSQPSQPPSPGGASPRETRVSTAPVSPSVALRRWLQTMRQRWQRQWAALVARWPLNRRRGTDTSQTTPATAAASTGDPTSTATATATTGAATAAPATVEGDGTSGVLPLTSCLPLPPLAPATTTGASSSSSASSSSRTAHVLVEVETVVDSRGSIPTWFVNFMQRQWPASTLATFRALAAKGDLDAHPAVACW